jgi:DnaK suppressor protein
MTGPTAVARRSRSKRNGVTLAQRRALRECLVSKRAELLSLYRHDLKVGQARPDEGTEDLVDIANKAYNQELMLQLSSTERSMVIEVDGAIDRLDADGFGVCGHCQVEIGLPRLNAVPWARYCISCQERDEKGMLD